MMMLTSLMGSDRGMGEKWLSLSLGHVLLGTKPRCSLSPLYHEHLVWRSINLRWTTDWPIECILPSNCQALPQCRARTCPPVSHSSQSEGPFVSIPFFYTWKAWQSKNGKTGRIRTCHQSGKVLKYNNWIEEQEERLRKTTRKHRGAMEWGFAKLYLCQTQASLLTRSEGSVLT